MQRRHHYERAFEAYLRSRRVPYVAVDEARKALLPREGGFAVGGDAIKSFDFVLYGTERNLLVDVKGRKVARSRRAGAERAARLGLNGGLFTGVPAPTRGRLESWVTREDVASLERWQQLFGAGFFGAFAFVYWCDEQPPDGLFQDVFVYEDRWYALRTVTVTDYARGMKARSAKWGTVDLPTRVFEAISTAGVGIAPHGELCA